MTKRQKLMSFATFTALCFLSGAPRAELTEGTVYLADASPTEHRPTTTRSCEEATQDAWFYRQLQITEGDTGTDIEVPAECQRERFAQHDDAN